MRMTLKMPFEMMTAKYIASMCCDGFKLTFLCDMAWNFPLPRSEKAVHSHRADWHFDVFRIKVERILGHAVS